MKRFQKWRTYTGGAIAVAAAGLLWSCSLSSVAAENRRETGTVQQATQAKAVQNTPKPTVSLVTDSVELRDAPLREALHFLFVANDIRYDSVDLYLGNYDTTFSYTGLSLAKGLQVFNEKGPSAFTYVVESGVYIVHPVKDNPNKPASKETTEVRYGENKTHRKDKKESDVLRRVSGLLRHEVRRTPDAAPTVTYFALLETTYFIGEDKDTMIRIVTAGTRITGGADTNTFVRVTKVDAKGVTLQPSGEKAFFVPLAPLSAVQK